MKKTYSFKISKTIAAPRKKVYAAWTDPKKAKKFSSPPGCSTTAYSIDFRVGGDYRIKMQTPGGVMKNKGTYLEIEPNRKIAQTFIWDVPQTEVNWITIEFKDRGSQTEMSLRASGFEIKGEAKGNREGWQASLDQFAESFVS